MPRQKFYQPSQFGFDKEIAKRLEYWDRKRREKSQD
jgi:putative ATPase